MRPDPQKIVKSGLKKAFTLPEVIVSFSILTLVIVTASNVLSVVMRTNADNVNSMVAYGIAQEGLENVRFMRDSDAVLGLDFDGGIKTSTNFVWGEKIMDSAAGLAENFILIDKTPAAASCTKTNLADCMPVTLKSLSGSIDTLAKDDSTLVYLVQAPSADPAKPADFQYLQTDSGTAPTDGSPTQFHRLIVVQPLKDPDTATTFNVMRVSSMVFWSVGAVDKKVVLTSELTDWK